MRTLCISFHYPWPPTSGYSIRLEQQIRALGTLGEVDFFGAVFPSTVPEPPPPYPPVRRWAVAEVAGRRLDPAALLDEILGVLPRRIGWRDWSEARAAFSSWVDGDDYDVVWFGQSDVYTVFADIVPPVPQFVDLDNLEDRTLRARRATRAPASGGGLGRRLRSTGARALDRIDAHRWRVLQQEIAERADAVALCSDLDRARFGRPETVVIPNGYETDLPPVSEPPPDPVLALIANFVYPPNADAASFAVHDILPRVRDRVPEAELWLIGHHDGGLDHLAQRPGVRTTGQVADAAAELRRARVALAPLRSGSGTRVKILEAFAHGIPVVSTTLGVDGIDARDGRDLLVGDDADALAAHTVELLLHDARWLEISTSGHRLWNDRYRWCDIRPLVVDAVLGVLGRGAVLPASSPTVAGNGKVIHP